MQIYEISATFCFLWSDLHGWFRRSSAWTSPDINQKILSQSLKASTGKNYKYIHKIKRLEWKRTFPVKMKSGNNNYDDTEEGIKVRSLNELMILRTFSSRLQVPINLESWYECRMLAILETHTYIQTYICIY